MHADFFIFFWFRSMPYVLDRWKNFWNLLPLIRTDSVCNSILQKKVKIKMKTWRYLLWNSKNFSRRNGWRKRKIKKMKKKMSFITCVTSQGITRWIEAYSKETPKEVRTVLWWLFGEMIIFLALKKNKKKSKALQIYASWPMMIRYILKTSLNFLLMNYMRLLMI